MKKTLFILTLFTVAASIFTSCSSGSGDPKTVLKAFFEKLAKKDIDGAAKLATADSKTTLDMVKKGMDMAENMKNTLPDSAKNDPAKDFEDVEIGEAVIDGNTATVKISSKSKKDKPAVDFTLRKEDGKWKVDFSMATLMQMGQQQINKDNTMQVPDTDSLQFDKETFKKAGEAIDSVMQNIDPKQLEELQKQIEKLKTPE
ncbi:MAG: DUF4878 domain-containing protein [Niabella sp.]